MTTDMVSRNPVVSHCPAAAETDRSAMIAGRATLSTVSFRIIRNAARARAPMMPVSCLVGNVGGACRDVVGGGGIVSSADWAIGRYLFCKM